MCNEPCPICSSHSHFVTECPQAHEFPEFVHKYVNTTQGCLNPSSNNSYSYTHSNEGKTHSNSSWTQEPWVEDTNMSYLSSHYIAPPEQPYQHDYPPLSKEIPDFEDRLKAFMQSQQIINSQVAQTSMDIKAQLDELTVMVEALQQEQIREVEIFYKEDNGEVCDAQSEPSSFEVELISEDHETLAQDLVTPPKEFTQCEDKVELLDCPTKSSIDVGLIDFLGVDKFNWVVDPYLIQLVNNLKTILIKDALVVEYRYLRHHKNKKF